MRLQVLGDLHLEFGCVDIPATTADVVVIAGDVDVGRNGLQWIQHQFPGRPVVYVLGNHEFYRHALPALTEQLIRETEGSQIQLLENRAVEVGGFVFLGCTFWTDFTLNGNAEKAMQNAETRMNDYRIVRNSITNRKLCPSDTRKIHLASISWLMEELKGHDPSRTIVVTHHAPSPRSEAPGYRKGLLSPAFVSDLGPLIEQSGIPLWIHGHTHYNVDYHIGATRVLTNQRGYPREACAGFDPQMVIEV
jgi:Icc-related predicted phosphoesterase